MDKIVKNDCSVGRVRFGNCGFGELGPGKRIGPALWEWFDLLCVHRGSVSLDLDAAGPRTLRRGEGLLILPRTPFVGTAGRRGARISVQHFELEAHPDSNPYFPEPLAILRGRAHGADHVRFEGVAKLEADIKRAITFAFTPRSPALDDLRVAQLVLILGQLQIQDGVLPAGSGDPREISLRRRLLEFARIQDVTPSMMAKWVNLSSSRFRVWFKARFGVSPKQYLVRQRVSQAMCLLRETQRPIKSIAIELGYADLPAFYHDFRRFTRTTPATYRLEHTIRA